MKGQTATRQQLSRARVNKPMLKAFTRMSYVKAFGLCAVAGMILPISGLTSFFNQAPKSEAASGSAERDYPFKPVPFTAVHMNDVFWAPHIETNQKVTIPYAFKQCEITGRVANFERAAEALRGELGDASPKLPGYPFDDTDIYKIIEGASYTLSVHPDPKLDAYVDSLIAKVAAAQEKDCYL